MGRTVDELLDSISYRELVEWALYYQMEPFGEWRGDLRVAQLTALTANINRDTKKRVEPYTPLDFMPFDPSSKHKPQKTAQPKQDASDGAEIAPETIQWLFAMGKVSNAELSG